MIASLPDAERQMSNKNSPNTEIKEIRHEHP